MCEYIKDDGEQCSIDTEPFCHHHEDSPQAKLWERMDVVLERVDANEQYIEAVADGVSGSSDGRPFGTMDTVCSSCETQLRRTERLTAHPNFDGRLLFEAVVECDCSEHVLGAQSVVESEVPDGW